MSRVPVSHSRHYPRALIAEFALVDTSWFLSPGHMPLVHRRQVRTDPVVLRLAAETAAAAGAFFLTFLTSSPVTEEPRQVVVPKVLQVLVPVPVGVAPAVPARPNSRDPVGVDQVVNSRRRNETTTTTSLEVGQTR